MNITTNRKAHFEYFVLDTIEAGIALQGTEVKAIRAKGASLDGSYAVVEDGELWLVDCHIDEYTHGNVYNHKPKRRRKLLLKKREIKKFAENAAIKGNALIPLSLYFKDGRVKVQLGMCKGKQKHDKRETIKKRDADRDMRMV
jgi:SsrA-binding protein